MARILSYGESRLVALLQIKVLDPVRAFCRSFGLNSPGKGRGAGAGGPLLPFPISTARTRASAMRNYHHCKPRCCGPSRYSSPNNSLSSHRVRRYHKARGRVGRPPPCRGAAYTKSRRSEPMRPFAQSDRHDGPGMVDEFVPGIAAVLEDVV